MCSDMPDTRFDRYWDLFLTDDRGEFDFTTLISTLAALQGVDRNATATGNQLKTQRSFLRVEVFNGIFFPPPPQPPVRIPGRISALPVSDLPAGRGYVASTATLRDISIAKGDNDVLRLVTWINDPRFTGKLRFSCHGIPGGKLAMGRQGVTMIDAQQVVDWLRANGLTEKPDPKKGLNVITASSCYSAVGDNLAPNEASSTMFKIARRLGSDYTFTGGSLGASIHAFPIHHIRVRGANEAVNVTGRLVLIEVPTGGVGAGPQPWTIVKVDDGKVQKGGKSYTKVHYVLTAPLDWELLPPDFVRAKDAIATPDAANSARNPNGGWSIKTPRNEVGNESKIPKLSNWLVTGGPIRDPATGSQYIMVDKPDVWQFFDDPRKLQTEPFVEYPGLKVQGAGTFVKLRKGTSRFEVES